MSSGDRKPGVTLGAFRDLGGPADILPLADKLRAKWCRPLQQVEAYWEAMRGGRTVPPRCCASPPCHAVSYGRPYAPFASFIEANLS